MPGPILETLPGSNLARRPVCLMRWARPWNSWSRTTPTVAAPDRYLARGFSEGARATVEHAREVWSVPGMSGPQTPLPGFAGNRIRTRRSRRSIMIARRSRRSSMGTSPWPWSSFRARFWPAAPQPAGDRAIYPDRACRMGCMWSAAGAHPSGLGASPGSSRRRFASCAPTGSDTRRVEGHR